MKYPTKDDSEVNKLLEREGTFDHHITKSYFRGPLFVFPHFLSADFDCKSWLQYKRNPDAFIPFKCRHCSAVFSVIDFRIVGHWEKKHAANLTTISRTHHDVPKLLRQWAFRTGRPDEKLWSLFVQQLAPVDVSKDPFVPSAQALVVRADSCAKAPPTMKAASQAAPKASRQPVASTQALVQGNKPPECCQLTALQSVAPSEPSEPWQQPTTAAMSTTRPRRREDSDDAATKHAVAETELRDAHQRPKRLNAGKRQAPESEIFY